jgi:hypothetical protein
VPVAAGSYNGMLEDFDAATGSANFVVTCANSGDKFKYTLFATIEERSL